jgi:hypothetical protein
MDPLEVERVTVQEVYRENANRIQGGLEALCSGDHQAAASHLFDALFVLNHEYADMEARRLAAYTGSDALLRKRSAIQQGGGGSSARDVLYTLAKRETTVQSFFHTGGSSGLRQTQTHSLPIPVNPNPITYSLDQNTGTILPTQLLSMGGAVQTYQQPGQQTAGRGRQWRKNNRGGQGGNFFQGFRGPTWRGQRGFGNSSKRGAGRGSWNANAGNGQSSALLPSPAAPIQTLPPPLGE